MDLTLTFRCEERLEVYWFINYVGVYIICLGVTVSNAMGGCHDIVQAAVTSFCGYAEIEWDWSDKRARNLTDLLGAISQFHFFSLCFESTYVRVPQNKISLAMILLLKTIFFSILFN